MPRKPDKDFFSLRGFASHCGVKPQQVLRWFEQQRPELTNARKTGITEKKPSGVWCIPRDTPKPPLLTGGRPSSRKKKTPARVAPSPRRNAVKPP